MSVPPLLAYRELVPLQDAERRTRVLVGIGALWQLSLFGALVLVTWLQFWHAEFYQNMLVLHAAHTFVWALTLCAAYGTLLSEFVVAVLGVTAVQFLVELVEFIVRVVQLLSSSHRASLSATGLTLAWVLAAMVLLTAFVDLGALLAVGHLHRLFLDRLRATLTAVRDLGGAQQKLHAPPLAVYKLQTRLFSLFVWKLFLFFGTLVVVLLALLDVSYYRYATATQAAVALQWVFELAAASQAEQGTVYAVGGAVGALHTVGLLVSFGLQVGALVSADLSTAQLALAWIVFALTLLHLALQAVTWWAAATVYVGLRTHERRVRRHLLPTRQQRAQHTLERQVALGAELVATGADLPRRRRRRTTSEYETRATEYGLEQEAATAPQTSPVPTAVDISLAAPRERPDDGVRRRPGAMGSGEQ